MAKERDLIEEGASTPRARRTGCAPDARKTLDCVDLEPWTVARAQALRKLSDRGRDRGRP